MSETLSGLPGGRRGQVLAVAITLIVVAATWVGIVAPLVGLWSDRQETLGQRRALLGRMMVLAQALPALHEQAQAADNSGPPPQMLLEGGSDAVASAALQQTLQRLATENGAALTSVEVLPGQAVGELRRVGLRASSDAPWSAVVRLFGAIDGATPRMLLDDVQFQGNPLQLRAADAKIDARFTVFAFRAGREDAPPVSQDQAPE